MSRSPRRVPGREALDRGPVPRHDIGEERPGLGAGAVALALVNWPGRSASILETRSGEAGEVRGEA